MSRQEPNEGLSESDRKCFRDMMCDKAVPECCSDVGLVHDKCL